MNFLNRHLLHRPLWVNLLAGLVLALLLFFLLLSSLKCLTGHGRATSVPSVAGKSYEEAYGILRKAGFSVDIQDSVYVDTMAPMTVIKQIPEADEVVKSNRKVYLVISRSVPPLVEMPNLVGYSFRNAEMVLRNLDLRIGDTIFKPDFAKNAVLEQRYNGQLIQPGTSIRKGSVISLVLGDGVGNREFNVPDLTGMTFCEARERLEGNGIILGAVIVDDGITDTCSAFIYRQNPERFDADRRPMRIRSGQTMDLWLQTERPKRDTARIPEPTDPDQ